MKTILPIVLFFLAIAAKATPLIDLMRSVNTEVDAQTDLPVSWKSTELEVANFAEAIQIHLLHVESVLRSRKYAEHSDEIQARRVHLLDVLHAYAMEGIFPKNLHQSFQTPVFIDDFGTHCAVGYLMKASGYGRLALKISRENNLAYVREIQVEGVARWAQKHGFTIAELAWIQPAYPPQTILTPLTEGINGTVYSMLEYNGQLIAAGSFDTAGAQPVANIAQYISGFAGWLWTDVAGGINGPVKKLLEFNGELIAAGSFSQAGNASVSNIAVLRNGAWEPFGTSIQGEIRELIIHNTDLYAFGSFELSNDATAQNIARWNGSNWTNAGISSNGPVNCAVSSPEGIWLGGLFSQCNGVACNNLALFNGSMVINHSNGIVTEINDLEWVNNSVFAAGDVKENAQVQGVMQFGNNNWTPLPGVLEMGYIDSTASVKKLYRYGDRLMAGGNFSIETFMVFGKSLAIWQDAESYPEPLTWLCDDENEFIEEIYFGEALYLGGSFASNFNPDIQGIVQLDDMVQTTQASVSEPNGFKAFPNPSNGSIELFNTNNADCVWLLDINGKHIGTHYLKEGTKIEVPGEGTFILQTNLGEVFRVIVK